MTQQLNHDEYYFFGLFLFPKGLETNLLKTTLYIDAEVIYIQAVKFAFFSSDILKSFLRLTIKTRENRLFTATLKTAIQRASFHWDVS